MKKVEGENIIGIGFLLIIVAGVISLFANNLIVLRVLLTVIAIGAMFVIFGYINLALKRKSGQEKVANNLCRMRGEYNSHADKLGVVRSNTQAPVIENTVEIPHHLWIADDILNMFPVMNHFEKHISAVSKPDVTKLQVIKIPITDILYFEELGELRKYAKVSGGGSSLKGALVGYALGGNVGAIIGSREPVKTDIISEDERKVELIYKNENGEIENLEFAHDAYAVLKTLIPDKELRRIKNMN